MRFYLFEAKLVLVRRSLSREELNHRLSYYVLACRFWFASLRRMTHRSVVPHRSISQPLM